MNITKMKKYIDNMYDVANVKMGFDYWYFKLMNVLLNLFEWDNLPTGLPAREIELNLIMTGHAVIVAKNDGSLFTPLTNLFNFDEYYQPTQAVFANVKVITTKTFDIGIDCEVIYNNSLQNSLYYIEADSGLNTFVARYARELADIESTLNIYTVNSRLVSYPVANDNSVKESLIQFFRNLKIGKRAIISDNSIIENFRNVDINRSNIKDGVNDWLSARDKILEQFYRDIGVKMHIVKKAQLNTEEVNSDNQLLLISTDDMLKARKEGIERVNDMFGTDIQVRINPLYQVKEEEYVQTNEIPRDSSNTNAN